MGAPRSFLRFVPGTSRVSTSICRMVSLATATSSPSPFRNHQSLVDSWVPWFEGRAAVDPGLRFYELPTIGRIWAPVRNFIDGGMAAAIRVPAILQRTLTIYGDVNRVIRPLGIEDRSTIALLLVDGSGHVRWRGSGGFGAPLAQDLDTALAAHRRG